MKRMICFIFCILFISSCSKNDSSIDDQPNQSITNQSTQNKFNIDTRQVTVSGISSGGYMANQYHIAYSAQVRGAALLASGPYGCARGELKTALSACMNVNEEIDIDPLYKNLLTKAANKSIDPLAHLDGDNVWIFHGQSDQTVSQEVVKAQQALYEKFAVKVKHQFDSQAGHGFPTLTRGVECGETKSPFINRCNLDVASQFLNYLYPKATGKKSSDENINGELIEFQQSKFLDEGEDNTLAEKGYLFVPSSCLSGAPCQLHIAFHGCQQNAETIDKTFIQDSGINQWASEHQLVVLYPQTKSSYMPLNPKACWDWWGYTGSDYLEQSGAQLKQVNNMVRDIEKILN